MSTEYDTLLISPSFRKTELNLETLDSNRALNFKDLTGKVFNDWTVLELNKVYTTNTNKKKLYYKCRCICGCVRNVRGESIVSGLSKGCGCRSFKKLHGRKKDDEELILSRYKSIYARYRNEAKRRNLDFSMEFDEYYKLATKPCYYCGKFSNKQKVKYGIEIKFNGIDRVDNTKGYSSDNIVSCCKSCNTKKLAVTPEIVRKVYEFLFK